MTPQHHGWVSSCARLSPLFSPLLPWPRHLHRRRLCASAPWTVSAAAAHLTLDLEAAAAPTPALEIQLASEAGEAPVDEREMLRRMRISQANKGNTPWNKGRKHSPETLQRIKERTRIAMQDPKVKQKLMNLGHAQSEETRLKIAQGVRRGWSLRRKKLMVQDGCFVEWRDIIADAARNGFAGGVALQWNSYKILTEKLRQDWLENLQKRRSMPRPRGNRRAPKTPEQRKKISEAIAAKWLDQGYRERVCSGITNYHGTPGTKTPRKSKPPKEPTVKRGHVKNKLIQPRSATIEAKVQTTAIVKRKKSGTPYKDPMAGEKLEMITKIRAQRAALETEKKEAIKRARALIAEAEKAADALEAVATRSSFVQASLVETRKLVAEARKSLRCAVDDKPPTQNASDDTSADSARFELDSYNLENQNNVMVPENKPVNGIQLPLSTVNGNYHFDVSDTFNEMKQFRVPHSIESSMERAYLLPSPSTALENVNKGLNVTNFHVSQSMANEAVRYDQTAEERTENDPSGTLENKVSSPMTKPKMRWMRGRLIEVGEE